MGKKELSNGQKFLIGFGIVVLVIILYIFAIYKPTKTMMENLSAQISETEVEIDTANVQYQKIENMQEVIEEGKVLGSAVEKYNSSAAEADYLYKVLADIEKYQVTFNTPPVTSDGLYVRRDVDIEFSADSYETAKKLLEDIFNCPYRTVIGNYIIQDTLEATKVTYGLYGEEPVKVSMNLTFIESCKDDPDAPGLKNTTTLVDDSEETE